MFVDDSKVLEALSRWKAHGAPFVKNALLAVVVCADDETTSDTWVEDASIATLLCQLAAQSVGLGSCSVQVRLGADAEGRSAKANVRDLLGRPRRPAGRVDRRRGDQSGHPAESLKRGRLHRGRW